MSVIKAININKTVPSANGDLRILKNINFAIEQADTVSIVGPSGSGKSTFISILAGLDLPTSGSVYMGENEITKLNEKERNHLRNEYTSFVFQSFHLLPSLTAIENVLLPLELRNHKSAKYRSEELLNLVGLENRAHHYPKHLSGGEKQRIAIARAIANEPKVLLADEPTGNLDKKTGENILNLIFDLNERLGMSIILVTHDQNAAKQCKKTVNIVDGELS